MKIQVLIYIVGYSLLYFLLSTSLYFLSVNSGYNGLSLPIFGGGDDGQFYYEQAMKFANGEPYIYTSMHVLVLGVILDIFNTDNVLILRCFNFISNILILVLSLLILKKISKDKTFHISATLLVLFLAFYPSLLLNSTLSIYRDSWIYAFFLWATYLFINIFISKGKWPKVINLVLLMFVLIMLGGYRKYALLSFVIGAMIYLFIKLISKKKVSLFKIGGLLFIGVSVFYILFRNFKFPVVGLSFSDVLQYRQANLEAGGSQMGISLDHSNILLFYANYLYSVLSNFIGPFPWQITGGSTLILMVTEGIIFFFISIYLVKKMKYFSKVELFLLIQAIVWFLLISISNDNFGTGSRLRIVGWLPLIIIFVKYYSEGIYRRKLRKLNS
ncbi:hypothetical protein CSE16_02765 [Solibacillus sp. R5-41]|uniref:hypothetical protein n=1 Tax=Solibacillus sp. R5-41 TaxID=2048654 RepID=UPI000C126945|nr:hypothetical protein [Solibacillus sp. R5-41]ATP39031.1 hypothetical protein CSE16_02765 [Solibacillus sp. R5-41]